jgi:hypothetical protein
LLLRNFQLYINNPERGDNGDSKLPRAGDDDCQLLGLRQWFRFLGTNLQLRPRWTIKNIHAYNVSHSDIGRLGNIVVRIAEPADWFRKFRALVFGRDA